MRRNIFGNYLINAVNLAIPIITAPIIARTLPLNDFATYSLLQVMSIYAGGVLDFGASSYSAREIVRDIDGKSTGFIWSETWSARILLAGLVLPILMAISFKIYGDWDTLLILSCIVICFSYAINSLWLLNGLEKTSKYSLTFLAIRSLSTAVLLGALYFTKNIAVIFFISSLGTLLSNLGTFFVAKKFTTDIGLRIELQQTIPYIKKSWPHTSSSLLALFLNSSTVLFGGIIVGKAAVAGISVSDRIVKGLLALASPFTIAVLPRITAGFSISHSEGFKRILRYGLYLMVPYSFLCLFAYFERYNILRIFGNQYIEFGDILAVLVLWSWLGVLNNFIGMQYMLGSNREKLYARVFLLGALMTVGGYFFLGKLLGGYGITIAALIGELVVSISATVLILSDVQSGRFRK